MNAPKGGWLLAGSAIIAASIIAGVLSRTIGQRNEPKAAAHSSPNIGTSPIVLPAHIQPQHTVNVPAPISGIIEQFLVDVGQEVFEGDLLAQIRSQSLTVSEQEAASAVESAHDKVNKLESSIIAARLEASRARADASRANAEYTRTQRIYQRQRMLLAEGATPKVVAQKAEKDFLAAQQEWTNLDAVAKGVDDRVDGLQKEYDNANKILAHLQQEQESVKAQVAAGQVHSPVNGVVVARRGEQGGSIDQSLQDMFRIAIDLTLLEAVTDTGAPVHPGDPAVVHVAESSDALPGVVKSVEPGRVVVEFTSPNPAIRPGLSAQLTFPPRNQGRTNQGR